MQTVAVPNSRINHRLLAFIVAAVLLVTLVSIAAARYLQSDTHGARSTPAQLAPTRASAGMTSSFGFSNCEVRRAC